ncbi:hypothetical protein OEZ85_013135 [Tetradesmus obliquus]|uniref:Cyclic nucleotide-binding domain-containing protein n=1 Tax=Tetradesmus obliquus TaxID=3088 RepID=A0ABY8U516_TETOB|nr:hypothetical protein OEZ85_013135 [Tetradesmus obliquus]
MARSILAPVDSLLLPPAADDAGLAGIGSMPSSGLPPAATGSAGWGGMPPPVTAAGAMQQQQQQQQQEEEEALTGSTKKGAASGDVADAVPLEQEDPAQVLQVAALSALALPLDGVAVGEAAVGLFLLRLGLLKMCTETDALAVADRQLVMAPLCWRE